MISFKLLSNKSYDLCIIDTNYDYNTKEAESVYFKENMEKLYTGLDELNNRGNLVMRIGDTFTTPTINK